MFGNPVKKLDNELAAGWIALSMPSPLGTEEKLNRIVNTIHQAALAVSAKNGRDVAVAAVNRERHLEATDDQGELWREMLDAVVKNL